MKQRRGRGRRGRQHFPFIPSVLYHGHAHIKVYYRTIGRRDWLHPHNIPRFVPSCSPWHGGAFHMPIRTFLPNLGLHLHLLLPCCRQALPNNLSHCLFGSRHAEWGRYNPSASLTCLTATHPSSRQSSCPDLRGFSPLGIGQALLPESGGFLRFPPALTTCLLKPCLPSFPQRQTRISNH